MKTCLRSLLAWRPGKLAKGTFAMSAGMGLRTLGQAAVFLIIARVLGVESYGAYSAVLALAMTLGGFGGLGASIIMLRETARDPATFAESWGRTLAALLVTVPVLFTVYLLLAWTVLPNRIGWVAIVCIGAAEILFSPLALAAMQAYQGHERLGRAAYLALAPVVPRLVAAFSLMPLGFVLTASMRLPFWSVLYLLAAVATAIYGSELLRRDFGMRSSPVWKGLGAVMKEGWMFSVGSSALKVYADVDKIMLARLATLEATGAYSAAYRIVDMSLVPMHALYATLTARYFRVGQYGLVDGLRYTFKILPFPLLYAVAAGLTMTFLGRLVPLFLGPSYMNVSNMLLYLAWLPLVTIWRDLLQKTLIGSGFQKATFIAFVSGAVLNLFLNLWLIPLHGWRGAVLATYAAELGMALILSALFVMYVRRFETVR